MVSHAFDYIHVFVSLLIVFLAWCIRWVWAGIYSEYGSRGASGEYLYDLTDPDTQSSVHLTGILLGVGLATIYWMLVLGLRRRGVDRTHCLHKVFLSVFTGIFLFLLLLVLAA